MKGYFMKNFKSAKTKLRKKFLLHKTVLKKLKKISKEQAMPKNKILHKGIELYFDSFLKSDLFVSEILEKELNDEKR